MTCVLVINSDRSARNAIETLLQMERFEVVTADGNRCGVRGVETSRLDALIVDGASMSSTPSRRSVTLPGPCRSSPSLRENSATALVANGISLGRRRSGPPGACTSR
jgi:hypothetical protein